MTSVLLLATSAIVLGLLFVATAYAAHRVAGAVAALLVFVVSVPATIFLGDVAVGFGFGLLLATTICGVCDARLRRAAPIMAAIAALAIGGKGFMLWQYHHELTAMLRA